MRDLSSYFRPLPGEDPCGPDLSYDPVMDAIGRAREVVSDALPVGIWEKEAPKASWTMAESLCSNVLLQRSKDLQVAAWLCEAWVHQLGLRGFADGVGLVEGLARTFWAGVHPRIEPDGDSALRRRPFNWLEEAALRWLSDGGPLCPLAIDPESAASAAAAASALYRLARWLDEHIGPAETAGFAKVCQRLNALAVVPRSPEPARPTTVSRSVMNSPTQAAPVAISSSSLHAMPNGREAAYVQLREIAAYLAKVEPHSPAATVIEALVAWRSDRFEDLLARLPQGELSVYTLAKLFAGRRA